MKVSCKICNAELSLFDHARVLNKYDVSYYECPVCGFVQTEQPYWLNESYSEAITSSDIGLVSRNFSFANKVNDILRICFPLANDFLDVGGGYGMFVRLMRDRGWKFEWQDEYCKNLFAKGHEMKKNHYDVITAFEMFEHLVDPLQTIKYLFSVADNIIFSTELVPVSRPKVNEWWYYGAEHGQHIAFYTKKCLAFIADAFAKKYTNLSGLHIFSDEEISVRKYNFFSRHKRLCKYFYKNKSSLLASDYELVTGRKLY